MNRTCTNCISQLERNTDFFSGVNSPIKFKASSNGDWTPYVKFHERQNLGFESDGCVLFTAQESFDSQINSQIINGTIPQPIAAKFEELGYMRFGLDNEKHFQSSPRFLHILAGTKQNGTSMQLAWDTMRKYGILPWSDLPFDSVMSLTEYFDQTKITKPMYDKALQFLALIGGRNAIKYQWIAKGVTGTPVAKMKAALTQAPLCIGIFPCEPWDQETPPVCDSVQAQHAVMAYNMDTSTHIEDHYSPFEKTLAFQYNIPYVFQGLVSFTQPPAVPPAPPLPASPDRQDIMSWLNLLKDWLLSLFPGYKGRKNP